MGLQMHGLLLSERPAVRIRSGTSHKKRKGCFPSGKQSLCAFLICDFKIKYLTFLYGCGMLCGGKKKENHQNAGGALC